MHDIRAIRDDPAGFDAGLARRGAAAFSGTVLGFDQHRRARLSELQRLQARRNEASREIGQAKAQGNEDRAAELMVEVARIKFEIGTLERSDTGSVADEALSIGLAALPNLPAPDVPDGADEHANVEVSRWGDPVTPPHARDHADFAPALGLDFDAGARIAGARFAALTGGVARLNRALGQYMLDRQTIDQGYIEVAPPLLVREAALFGTGQLPKFADDLFRTTDDRWLIPTAEVSLTNLVRETILAEADLPLRYTALTPCFRAEAGAAGRDTRGLIRQHQFDKVELVSITTPDAAAAEHERMTRAAEAILEGLGLPYRRMLLCAGDMGFTARKTYDLEVWLPGQRAYREISSCSDCGDFQARRMDARYRPAEGKGTAFVHTLNGSGLAVGRTLVAVLENGLQPDGSVALPPALLPYMGGIDRLRPS